MKRLALLLAVGMLLDPAAAAPQPRSRQRGLPAYYSAFKSKDDQGRFSRVVLRNGLTIVVEEETLRPLAAVATYVKSGDADGARRGTASALAAKILASSEFDSQIRRLGGYLTLDVGEDHSAFVSLVPSDNVLGAVDSHAGLLADQLFEGGIEAGAGDAAASPDAAVSELRRLAGFEPALETSAFDEAALKEFHRARYDPANVVLAVSGAVNRNRIFERVVARFGGLKSSRTPEAAVSRAADAPEPGFRYLPLRGRTAATRLLFGFAAPGRGHPDYHPMLVLAEALGQGRGSLLKRGLSEGDLALDAQARLLPENARGFLEIEVDPAPGKLDSAEIRCLAVLKALGEKDLVAPELDRAKALLTRRFYQGVEALHDRALRLAGGEARGDYLEMEREVGRILAVSAEKVAQAAAKYLTVDRLSLVESLSSEAEERSFDSERLRTTWELLLPAELEAAGQRLRGLQGLRKEAAKLPESFAPNLIAGELKRTSVLRGPDIFLDEQHLVPLVELGLFYPGGRMQESAENAGITEVMLRALVAGEQAKAGAALWAEIEGAGAEVAIVNEPDFFGVRATLLSGDLPGLLGRLLQWFKTPEWDADAVALGLRETELEAAKNESDSPCAGWTSVASALFKDHSYGRSRYGDAASRGKLNLEAVRGWAKKQTEGFHPMIVVRGDVQGTSFLPDLIPMLSDSKLKRKPPPDNPARDPGREFASCRDLAGGVFHLAVPGPVRGTRDAWVFDIWQSLVYLLGDRLPSEDAAGRPYNHAELERRSLAGGGMVGLRARAAPEALEAAETAARRDLGALAEAPIREIEGLNALVLTITRHYMSQQKGARDLVELARQLVAGEKPNFREEYLTTLKGVKIDDLRAVAGRYFPKSRSEPVNQEPQQP